MRGGPVVWVLPGELCNGAYLSVNSLTEPDQYARVPQPVILNPWCGSARLVVWLCKTSGDSSISKSWLPFGPAFTHPQEVVVF